MAAEWLDAQAAFARREGVRYPTFASWVQPARQGDGPARARVSEPIEFAEVARRLRATPGLEVRWADGTLLRGESAAELAKLVRALRA